MNWYVAEAVFESGIEHSGSSYSPLIDRTWFLVSAEDEPSAEAKAEVLARSKEHSYANAEGETVHWTFSRIERLREVMDDQLGDGTEVWSVITEADEHVSSTHDPGERT